MKKIFLITILSLFFVMRQNVAYAGRPFSTEDAGVAGKGVSQFELGAEYLKQDNGEREYGLQFVPIFGLTERIELSAELFYKRTEVNEDDDIKGLEDISVAVKVLAVKEGNSNPALALKTVIKFDNGDKDKDLGSGDKDLSLVAVATKGIDKVTIHASLGYTFVGKDDDPTFKDYILYGVAGEYSITDTTNLMAELYGESNSHFHLGVFKHHDLQTLIGFSFKLTEKIVFDSGVKAGLAKDSPDFGLSFGLSVDF